jgi:hypothetical protein
MLLFGIPLPPLDGRMNCFSLCQPPAPGSIQHSPHRRGLSINGARFPFVVSFPFATLLTKAVLSALNRLSVFSEYLRSLKVNSHQDVA